MRKRFITTIIFSVTCSLLFTQLVFAQGDGIRLSKGITLNPMLGATTEYNSNVSLSPDSSTSPAVSDFIFKVSPGVGLSIDNDKFVIDFVGKLKYHNYFGMSNKETKELSSLFGNANLALGYTPTPYLSVYFIDIFARTAEPRNQTVNLVYLRYANQTMGRIQLIPGGGALIMNLDVNYKIDYYAEDMLVGLNFNSFIVDFTATWKFFPKTGVTFQFNRESRRYADPNKTTLPNGDIQNTFQNADSDPIKLLLGLVGQITPKFSLNLQAGYGSSEVPDTDDNFSGLIGKLEANQQFSQNTNIRGGIQKSFSPVSYFNYNQSIKMYLNLKQNISSKVYLTGVASIMFMSYGDSIIYTNNLKTGSWAVGKQNPYDTSNLIENGTSVELNEDTAGRYLISVTTPDKSREDTITSLALSLKYDIQKWLNVSLSYSMLYNNNDYKTIVESVVIEKVDDISSAADIYNDENEINTSIVKYLTQEDKDGNDVEIKNQNISESKYLKHMLFLNLEIDY